MTGKFIIVAVIILSILGCSSIENSNDTQLSMIQQVNEYDPTTIAVNDIIGTMTASEVSIKDYEEGRPIVDVRFESEAIQIEGTFENLKASGFDTDVIMFIPNEKSSEYFPMHNLFEHQIKLYITDKDKVEMFDGEIEGTARITVKDYYDYVHYKDELYENTNLIEVKVLK